MKHTKEIWKAIITARKKGDCGLEQRVVGTLLEKGVFNGLSKAEFEQLNSTIHQSLIARSA